MDCPHLVVEKPLLNLPQLLPLNLSPPHKSLLELRLGKLSPEKELRFSRMVK
jgi:hypothetical protein